ncbi:MAG: hypothetical protein ABF700_10580, partial [Liquorilactobacillus ghanensis]
MKQIFYRLLTQNFNFILKKRKNCPNLTLVTNFTFYFKLIIKKMRLIGIEPMTYRLGGGRSILL